MLKQIRLFLLLLTLLLVSENSFAQVQKINEDSIYIRNNYTKSVHQIPMRDGVKLYTVVYAPKATNTKYPFMLNRTPYSVGPYEDGAYKTSLGPSPAMMREGYIFVYQDVRGKYMSEGEFIDMRPHKAVKKGKKEIDESTDTYDSIDWLVKNIGNNNGKLGMWGISYPGFYAATALMSNHPALIASSPQAPIADWYWDDFHHNGAFFLPHAFNFLSGFGQARPAPTTKRAESIKHGTPDGYDFFMRLGPLKNANERYFKNNILFWNQLADHPDYDEFWKERNLLPHLKNIKKTAIMTVGGWFDAEDLYGPLRIYEQIEKNNPKIYNTIVMGPWRHGGWARDNGESLGNAYFGSPTSLYYQEKIELPFFNYYLKNKGTLKLPEAYMFETGTNRWREFAAWPPKDAKEKVLYFHTGGKLSFEAPANGGTDEFISDPAKPVPFSEVTAIGMTKEYMTDDQRFASRRPDVLVYQTDTLQEDLTLAGNILSALKVSTSGTDADWVIKLIDVYPDYHPDFPTTPDHIKMGGYQQMVRSEVIRGRYRNSFEKPEPFVPGQVTDLNLELLDVLHTFKKGHRIMIQVQSTWFPLVDRNPQKYVENIFKANEEDFIKATHKLHSSPDKPSKITIKVL